jgi:hypothetical protein
LDSISIALLIPLLSNQVEVTRKELFLPEGGCVMSKARQAIPTVTFVDEYCQLYQDLFPDVRSFEHFKLLHVGMLSEIKRKTLPAIARGGGDLDPQALDHFVTNAPWRVEDLRGRRLTLLRQALADRPFILGIRELLTIPVSRRETIDIHEPFSQRRQPLKLGFHQIHGLLGQFDPGLIGSRHQGDHGMFAFPGHGARILDHGVA